MGNKIEGGPACEYSAKIPYGERHTKPRAPNGEWPEGESCRGGVVYYYLGDTTWEKGKCTECCEGIKPLSEWTDAQKAEWLKNNRPWPYKRGNTEIYADELEINVTTGEYPQTWYVEYRTGPHPHDDDHVVLGQGPDLSIALTAAVEAVAKERENATS